MNTQGQSFTTEVGQGEEAVIQLLGVEPADGVMAHLINVDPSRGLVASIIHIKAGTTIPAHYHESFAEAHYVLDGDLINDGVSFGPGGFITHAPGVVHGPHSSRNGCRVLTIQTGHPGPEQSDHHVADGGGQSA
jgi:mannose-6-phosphate isomerase-like protein (cupin superfamily)